MKTLKLMPLALIALFSFNSCSNDDTSQPVNEEEIITTVTITLTPEDGSQAVILTSRDLDGDGPNMPIFTSTGTIAALKNYNGTVSILNELTTPVEDIALEIAEEGADHQFFYKAIEGLSGNFEYADEDENGNPIGLKFIFTPSANTQSGFLNLILKHNPNKLGQNVGSGDITNAGGATDIEVSFPVTVE
ncbi:type 1 periplasmic binding fold superfamily protein [Flavobacterium sp.]|uniref:type 1 periplasmic binding fold superfamily protein n=1 Tax=Flavobacterium sp. TaxID=239 RepID=UPI002613F605|nr:type 1 periplasmic binding fold superfamily protein [Flavobacterium sp.]MDD3005411.1 type 1 periplasmic binding fold superfamily protein [Flavobacterium sp.]